MMTKCKACGRPARVTKIAHLVGQGVNGRGRVCVPCFTGGMTIVAVRVAPVVDTHRAERQAQKEALSPFLRQLENLVKGHRTMANGEPFIDGKIEGLEAAIHILKTGRA